ncbi:disease resistance protein RUN1-like [Cryptomeria japonica]|uniref:disease resistance protein RUN1-like n=1 Tax=Cryptomeria japonica TaxID=3369 RepID=UPI0027DAAC4E|nr:disease resistance protein RUN1-like [Cryptomeria japonica]
MEGGFPSYHVTINHRGPDVKKTLASLIYRNLRKYGLRVFLDVEELQIGDSSPLAIERAIQSASLHICIFSETYAESAWCLNELVWILACENAKVIPIFYGIQPSDLRYTVTGAYAEAFRNHRIRGRVDTQRLKIWQNALNKVSHISGLVFIKEKDDLGELMDRIEDTVLREVRREALDVARYPVGLDKAAEHFQNEVLYETELSDIKVVGIVGPGGSGKSTLARHLYNAKRFEFSRCCFLSEVSEKKLSSVQQKLVTKLVGFQPHEHIDNTSEGRSTIQHRLAGYRVFIVFDGVDNMDQMENLLFVVKEVIGSGSLIFVTSRDRGLLASSEIKTLYDVKLLNVKDSQKLFCFHAFQRPEPSEGFQDLVHELVNLCGGFPLALKVLGGYLSGKSDRSYWIRQVGNFRKQLPENILDKVLRQSYDSLERKEKEAFLDVAHFLVGENKDLAIRVLEGLGHSGKDCLDTLHQKGLVEFQSLNVDFNINVEDQYIMPFDELGNPICLKQISGLWGASMQVAVSEGAPRLFVREGHASCLKARYLWLFEEWRKVEENNYCKLQSKPYSVRGIYSDEDHEKLQLPEVLQDEEICGLNILMLRCPLDINNFSGDLIWLRLTKCNCICIPSSLSLTSLRVLELSDVNLKDLNILCDAGVTPSQPFSKKCLLFKLFPSGLCFHRRRNYEVLSSSRPENRFQLLFSKVKKIYAKIVSKNMKILPSLPIKFQELKALTHLDLSGCSNLEELPTSFTQLLELQYLSLRDCKKLVLKDLGEISTLEYLDLEGCILLSELPRGTTHQRSLRYLNVLHTTVELPEGLEQLESLEQLFVGSIMLRTLPSSLNNLGQLKELILFECFNLSDIGDSIGKLVHLERLRISRCSAMRMLPERIAWTNIKNLDVRWCLMFEGFKIENDSGRTPSERFLIRRADPGADDFSNSERKASHHISCLTNLIIRDSRITQVYIPQAKSLCPNLETVDLSNNLCLTRIEGLPDSLISLKLMDCRALKALTCLSNLTRLKSLDISGCDGLESLNVEDLSSIEEIKADKCWRLSSMRGLAQLKNLSYFQISTYNTVSSSKWREILHFKLKRGQSFPSSVSTAILYGATVNMEDIGEMEGLAHSYQDVTVRGIPSGLLETGMPVSVKFVYGHLEGAILVCLVAHKCCKFEVTVTNRAQLHDEAQKMHIENEKKWVFLLHGGRKRQLIY